jgi:hypothetical protein
MRLFKKNSKIRIAKCQPATLLYAQISGIISSGFKGSGVQRFRGSEVQRFRGSEVQGFRGSKVQLKK